MANVNTKRIVTDGPNNAVVELVGILDTSVALFAVAPAIVLADFVNNNTGATLAGLRIDKIQYSMNDNLTARLYWNATVDQLFAAFAGRGKMCFEEYNGLQPDRGAVGYDGAIDLFVDNVVVSVAEPIQVYTLTLEMSKLYSV